MTPGEQIARMLECDLDEVVERVSALVADVDGVIGLLQERAEFEGRCIYQAAELDQHSRLREPMAFEATDRCGWNCWWMDVCDDWEESRG